MVDLILGILILFYFLGHAGGLVKTLKNLLLVLLFLMIFGVFAQFILSLDFAEAVHPSLNDSYLIKASHTLIRWFYPMIENGAPKVNSFIKQKILAAPPPEVTLPTIKLSKENLPQLDIPELPKLE